MQILGPGRAQWEWFVALHPLFERALPSEQLLAENKATLWRRNDITLICHAIRAIPLVFPKHILDRDLEQSKYDSVSSALGSLLEVFETLVVEDVLMSNTEQRGVMAPEESELYKHYPKLAALKTMLGQPEHRVISTMTSDRSKTSSAEEALARLAKHIDYIGSGKSGKYDFKDVKTAITIFKSRIEQIFADPVETLEKDLGNAGKFNHGEIEFIRRAHRLNTISQSLFQMLVRSIACSKTHKARLHLSGFLDPEINFELFISECEQKHWKITSCRFVDQEWPRGSNRTAHGLLCNHSQLTRPAPENLRIAFNSVDIWDDETHDVFMVQDQSPGSGHTLCELLLPKRDDDDESGSELDVQEFVEEDQKIVELLVASSLFNLNASPWLRADMNIKSIHLESSPNSDRRWKPLVTCSLKAIDVEDDIHDAILSFGLLLMEMEGKKTARPEQSDMDWEKKGHFSKDSMLRRIIKKWDRIVSDGYKRIATACLQFRELSARLYDPGLTQDMGQSAAIYKYILAPLHKLTTQQYSNISPMFTNFPMSHQSALVSRNYSVGQATSNPSLILFDGFDSHDPKTIQRATTFWDETETFRNMINNLSSSPIPSWADGCRKEKIRIAIIDTGIDEHDITIEEAMGERIKECCGFINGPDAEPDSGDYEDHVGHGTHVARLMLNMAPSAELYIAKISNESNIRPINLHRVTRAIKWAHKEKRVHIISMSFGLGITQNVETDRAIVAAKRDGITMFAAAANSGGNKPRAYPASRGSPVICVHASDGLGNDGGISPDPLPDESNFSTLGISIASKWKGHDVFKSGTSFATPIAAALAADVLEFARHRCDLDEFELNNLRDYDGICKILKLMARKRQDHDYLTPLHLWNGENDDEAIVKMLYRIAGR